MNWKICGLSVLLLLQQQLYANTPTGANAQHLKVYVQQIVGPMEYARNYKNIQELSRVSGWISEQMRLFGIPCQKQTFNVNQYQYHNVVCRLNAGHKQKMIVGANYDVEGDHPGINHNASGVAGVIETARLLNLNKQQLKQNVDFVFYSLAEAPFAKTEHMGSVRHAKSLLGKDEVTQAVYVLDKIGRFSTEAVQQYPIGMKWMYPSHANFIAVVSNIGSRELSRQYCEAMQQLNKLDCERFVVTNWVENFESADHLSYWQQGIPAALITDTGSFREQQRYRPEDELKQLNYAKMAMVVNGLVQTILKQK